MNKEHLDEVRTALKSFNPSIDIDIEAFDLTLPDAQTSENFGLRNSHLEA